MKLFTKRKNLLQLASAVSLNQADIENPIEQARRPHAPAAGRQGCEILHSQEYPRTVIRGESPVEERNKSQAALTDWLNVSFPFHSENNNPKDFFIAFSQATNRVFGGMTDQERGIHGWKHSFKFDHGCVIFAYGGQNNTAFLSLPGEGCAFISDWQSFAPYLKDQLRARITRWDGAVDDFLGIRSVDLAVELYKQGGFNAYSGEVEHSFRANVNTDFSNA